LKFADQWLREQIFRRHATGHHYDVFAVELGPPGPDLDRRDILLISIHSNLHLRLVRERGEIFL
jgi:hypothetical protein